MNITSQAEAIRKILGQGSDKKKEEKKQKELEEKVLIPNFSDALNVLQLIVFFSLFFSEGKVG